MVKPFDKAWRLLKAPTPFWRDDITPLPAIKEPASSTRHMAQMKEAWKRMQAGNVPPENLEEDENECPDCGGLGYIEQMVPAPENPNVDPEDPDEWIEFRPTCTTCKGTVKKKDESAY